MQHVYLRREPPGGPDRQSLLIHTGYTQGGDVTESMVT